jgi:hypothetical protein
MGTMSSFQFASNFDVIYKNNFETTNDYVENYLCNKNIILPGGLGMIRQRVRPAVIKTLRYSRIKDTESYYYSLLYLYLPFRNESELKSEGYTSLLLFNFKRIHYRCQLTSNK